MALKFSKEKKDPTQKLINLGFKSLLGPVGAVATNYLKNKIVKNILPYGYENPLTRIKNAVLDKEDTDGAKYQEDWRARVNKGKILEDRRSYKSGGLGLDEIMDENRYTNSAKERRDLLSIGMLDGKQQHNSVPISKYKPTNSTNKNMVYYSSPSTENAIRQKIKLRGIESVLEDFKPNEKGIPSLQGKLRSGKINAEGREYGVHDDDVLGNFTQNLGEDEKGKYISYYDTWDLNPFSGKSKMADAITTGAQYAAGINPPEVYGRIYY
tara:strand:+ start:243 stop:1046 length:804 start_codon:yes stop_codon:yes gene_type:complete